MSLTHQILRPDSWGQYLFQGWQIVRRFILFGVENHRILRQVTDFCQLYPVPRGAESLGQHLWIFLQSKNEQRTHQCLEILKHISSLEKMALDLALADDSFAEKSPGSDPGYSGSEDEDDASFTYIRTPLKSHELELARAALDPSGSGNRLDQLRHCYRCGYYQDFRLIHGIMNGLGDPDPECARFITEKILPANAQRYKKHLLRYITHSGKARDVRAFQAYAIIDPMAAARLGFQLIPQVGPHFQAEIIYFLARQKEYLEFSLSWAKSEDPILFSAAVRGLAWNSWSGKWPFFKAILSNPTNWKELRPFLRSFASREMQSILWEQFSEGLMVLLSGVRSRDPADMPAFLSGIEPHMHLLGMVNPAYLSDAQVAVVVGFLERREDLLSFARSRSECSVMADFLGNMIQWLAQSHEINGPLLVSQLTEPLPSQGFLEYFFASLENLRPDEFFLRFHRYVVDSPDVDLAKRQVLMDFFRRSVENPEFGLRQMVEQKGICWDSRWIDWVLGLNISTEAPAAYFANPYDERFAIRFLQNLQSFSDPEADSLLALRGFFLSASQDMWPQLACQLARCRRDLAGLDPSHPAIDKLKELLRMSTRLHPQFLDVINQCTPSLMECLENPVRN